MALSALGFLSHSTLTGPRVTFAMARDGLFFRRLAAVDPARHVPSLAIALQAAWAGVLALTGSYEQILSYVVSTNFLFFGVCAAALFVLRAKHGAAFTGFRAPGHPWTSGLFILACAVVVASALWSFPVSSPDRLRHSAGRHVPPYLYWAPDGLRSRSGPADDQGRPRPRVGLHALRQARDRRTLQPGRQRRRQTASWPIWPPLWTTSSCAGPTTMVTRP